MGSTDADAPDQVIANHELVYSIMLEGFRLAVV